MNKTIASSIVNQNWEQIFKNSSPSKMQSLFVGSVFRTLSSIIHENLLHDNLGDSNCQFNMLMIYLDGKGSRYSSKFFKAGQVVNEDLDKIYQGFSERILKGFDFTALLFEYFRSKNKPKPFLVEFKKSSKNKSSDEKFDLIEFNIKNKVVLEYDENNNAMNFVTNRSGCEIFENFIDFFDQEYNNYYYPDIREKLEEYIRGMKCFIDHVNVLTLIPLWLGPNLNMIPIGSILITSREPLSEEEIRNVIKITRENISPIRTYEFFSQVINETKKSAIAAIMSRNMSHNIGSHVLTSVATEKNLDLLNVNKNQNLYRFLQNRMDFIAQVSTEFPKWTYSAWFCKQVLKEFFMQSHILTYIANSEGIRKDKLKFRVVYNDDYIYEMSHENDLLITDHKDCLIAIPGGMIGNHAFYIILEDIIRNSAKHSYAKLDPAEKESTNLQITIKIDNKTDNNNNADDENVIFTIYDNISEVESDYDEDLAESYFGQDLPLHQKMNYKLTNGLLDDKGQLRKENWGLAEMKIAAGYLQKKEISVIGQQGHQNLEIIKAVAEEIDGKYHLGYKFTIPKPKEVILIGFQQHESDLYRKIGKKEFISRGVYFNNRISTIKDYEFMILNDNVEYRFVELLNNVDLTNLHNRNVDLLELKKEIEKLPYRLFIVSDTIDVTKSEFLKKRIVILSSKEFENMVESIKGSDSIDKFKLQLYSRWLTHLKTFSGDGLLNLTIKTFGTDSECFNLEEDIAKDIFNKVKSLNDEQKQEIKEILGLERTFSDSEGKDISIDLPDYLKEVFEMDDDKIARTNKIAYIHHQPLTSSYAGSRYFENLSGAALHFPILENRFLLDEYHKRKLLCQLVENGLLKIGIADERICNSSIIQSDLGGIPNLKYLEAAKIYIINKINDWHNKIDDYNLELLEEGHIKGSQNESLDVLIIHQGIIDKLNWSNEKIVKWINTLKENIPFVIITSGRGRPDNIPINTKFLPFSIVESFVLSKPHHKLLLSLTLLNVVE